MAKPAKPPTNVLTDKQVAAFEAFLGRWQAWLNLLDWRVSLSKTPAGKRVLSEVQPDLESRMASVRLNRHWGENNSSSPVELERVACHEMLHVFLRELIDFAQDSRTSDEDLASFEHRVVHTLVTVLVP